MADEHVHDLETSSLDSCNHGMCGCDACMSVPEYNTAVFNSYDTQVPYTIAQTHGEALELEEGTPKVINYLGANIKKATDVAFKDLELTGSLKVTGNKFSYSGPDAEIAVSDLTSFFSKMAETEPFITFVTYRDDKAHDTVEDGISAVMAVVSSLLDKEYKAYVSFLLNDTDKIELAVNVPVPEEEDEDSEEETPSEDTSSSDTPGEEENPGA